MTSRSKVKLLRNILKILSNHKLFIISQKLKDFFFVFFAKISKNRKKLWIPKMFSLICSSIWGQSPKQPFKVFTSIYLTLKAESSMLLHFNTAIMAFSSFATIYFWISIAINGASLTFLYSCSYKSPKTTISAPRPQLIFHHEYSPF